MTPDRLAHDVLSMVDWGERTFGSLTTSRGVRRRDVLRCVAEGWVKSIGMVSLCDDDCSTIYPERFREGFVLTDAGRARLKGLETDYWKEMEADRA